MNVDQLRFDRGRWTNFLYLTRFHRLSSVSIRSYLCYNNTSILVALIKCIPIKTCATVCANISSILFIVIRKYTLVFEQGNEKSGGPIVAMLRVLEIKIHFSQKLYKKISLWFTLFFIYFKYIYFVCNFTFIFDC